MSWIFFDTKEKLFSKERKEEKLPDAFFFFALWLYYIVNKADLFLCTPVLLQKSCWASAKRTDCLSFYFFLNKKRPKTKLAELEAPLCHPPRLCYSNLIALQTSSPVVEMATGNVSQGWVCVSGLLIMLISSSGNGGTHGAWVDSPVSNRVFDMILWISVVKCLFVAQMPVFIKSEVVSCIHNLI